jgi:hypothetical protein
MLNTTSQPDAARSASRANRSGDSPPGAWITNSFGHFEAGQSAEVTSTGMCPAAATPCASLSKYASAPPVAEYPRLTKPIFIGEKW